MLEQVKSDLDIENMAVTLGWLAAEDVGETEAGARVQTFVWGDGCGQCERPCGSVGVM